MNEAVDKRVLGPRVKSGAHALLGEFERQFCGVGPELTARRLAGRVDLLIRFLLKACNLRRRFLADALGFLLHLGFGFHAHALDISTQRQGLGFDGGGALADQIATALLTRRAG